MKEYVKIIKNGMFHENPIFEMMLGMCSALAISTSLTNAIGMGLAVTLVLMMSNVLISLLRKLIPEEIRIPIFIVIIATAVKCIQLLMNAFTPALYDSLGVFIPLIVVNCIILGRAESFAFKNNPIASLCDAIGMGLGYTGALCLISFFRELIGTGGILLENPFNTSQVFIDISLFPDYAISLLRQPSGAFITLGCLLALLNYRQVRKAMKIVKGDQK